MKSAPLYRKEDEDKINKLDLTAYFDDYMRRRPFSKTGYINLAMHNFRKMADRAKTENDFQTMMFAYVNYIGHRNLLPQKYIDLMMMKAVEYGQAEIVLDMFKYHTELMYHPHPDVTQSYFDYFNKKGYDSLKKLFDVIKGNYYLQKPKELHLTLIDQAYDKKDYLTVIEAFLDILDYD